jgi:hypothetical protein
MVSLTPLDSVVAVGLSMAIPLFAISARRCDGSPFSAVLAPLCVVLALGVATAFVDVLAFGTGREQAVRLVFVGAAAVLTAVTAFRLHRMTAGEWSR